MIVLKISSLKNTAKKRPAGYLEDVLSKGVVSGDKLTLTADAYNDLMKKYRGTPAAKAVRTITVGASGPGTELKTILEKIGITASSNCSCSSRARTMDANEAKEPGWCERNIETICDWLQEEAAKRKLPFVRLAARLLVRRAISNARRKSALTD